MAFFNQDVFKDKHLILMPVDEGFFTGGCHYSFECDGFRYNCDSCPAVSKLLQGIVRSRFKGFPNTLSRPNTTILFPSSVFHEKWQDSLCSDSYKVGHHVFTLFPKNSADVPANSIDVEKNLSVDDSALIFLIRSSKEARKGCALFVEVCRQLGQMMDDFSSKAVIHTVGDEYLRSKLDGMCTIEHHGLISESCLNRLYKGADVFVSPSIQDSGPMMVLEALAEGCHVICSDVGYGSMLSGGVGVEVVERNDVASLREAMLRFISQGQKLKEVRKRNLIKQHSAALRKENIEKLRVLFS